MSEDTTPNQASSEEKPSRIELSRRTFVKSSAAAGMIAAGAPAVLKAQDPDDTVQVALLGCGEQSINAHQIGLRNLPNVRIRAVCDIWKLKLQAASRGLSRSLGYPVNGYEDYREMLDKEKEVQAVFIATPDFWHSRHTVDCLSAGKHVYCEKMMADTVDNARAMVKAARDTGNLLQIGHQRRSNPRYLALLNGLIRGNNSEKLKILGRLTHCYAQWNRSKERAAIDPPRKEKNWVDQAKLTQYGYKDMHEFLNWRWFKKYSAGPISDLGAHQIDIFNWFLNATPTAVMATGGTDYFKDNEHYDNIMALYDYDTADGAARAYYQVLTTTSANGFYERFMGDNGTAEISEMPNKNFVYNEGHAPDWKPLERAGLLMKSFYDEDMGVDYAQWQRPREWSKPQGSWVRNTKKDAAEKKRIATLAAAGITEEEDEGGTVADSRGTAKLAQWELPTVLAKPPHQPHIENFLEAVVKNDKSILNCPAEEAFRTCVTVLRVNEAVAAGTKLRFSPEDFVA